MKTRLPFVLAPDLDLGIALDLIDELVNHVRRITNLPRTAATQLSSTVADDSRVFIPPADGAPHRRNDRRKSGRSNQPARLRYSIAPVRNGQVLNIKNATPATMKLIDYMRAHPAQLQTEIAEGTQMSKNTIANQFSLLRKHGALVKQDADTSTTRG